MLLRKKPLKWVDHDDDLSAAEISDDEEYVVEHFSSGWKVLINGFVSSWQHPTREAAKQAAEEHWAAVVPPGCERVELCEECAGYGLDPFCPDCHGEGCLEVK